jgi:hypothetical protein
VQTAPPIANGAALLQPMPVVQGQLQQPGAIPQRPMMPPANMGGAYVPQNQGSVAPMTTHSSIGQQPIMAPMAGALTAPAGPMVYMPQSQVGMMPQQPMSAVPTQQVTTMAAQPMVPQQGYQPSGSQPLPSANGMRTTVNYGPRATIPWR